MEKIINLFNKLFNKNDFSENKLLKKYGKAYPLKKYNLKLLFLADTHNCLKHDSDVLNYIKENDDYDYCILLGDHSASDLDMILKIVPLNKICGVLGNHDSWDKYTNYGITNIGGNIIDINDLKIAGMGGSFKYKRNDEYAFYTQEESIEIAKKIGNADIFVTHDKAFTEDNHNPVHDGLKGITNYIYTNHIPLHIHGHLHENMEEVLKNGTKSIGIYIAKIIKI